jgi:hypothetical protein
MAILSTGAGQMAIHDSIIEKVRSNDVPAFLTFQDKEFCVAAIETRSVDGLQSHIENLKNALPAISDKDARRRNAEYRIPFLQALLEEV